MKTVTRLAEFLHCKIVFWDLLKQWQKHSQILDLLPTSDPVLWLLDDEEEERDLWGSLRWNRPITHGKIWQDQQAQFWSAPWMQTHEWMGSFTTPELILAMCFHLHFRAQTPFFRQARSHLRRAWKCFSEIEEAISNFAIFFIAIFF